MGAEAGAHVCYLIDHSWRHSHAEGVVDAFNIRCSSMHPAAQEGVCVALPLRIVHVAVIRACADLQHDPRLRQCERTAPKVDGNDQVTTPPDNLTNLPRFHSTLSSPSKDYDRRTTPIARLCSRLSTAPPTFPTQDT